MGHYEIVETIGKGGMGEVYRARDTRLPRDTAIKVSAERFSERFAREAHAIASLNHPNITTLYDVGPDYLVMELVEGPTLADRIRQGVLTLDEASAIARQIADALEYAHEKGVIHRDLKPGNVKIHPDGVVKVLDFGLAKSGLSSGASRSDESPTISAHQTEAGVVLGTTAYMAPEQAKGKEVDKRADIWAFGCVFYEMLTGAPPHQGDSSQETLVSILRDAPDLDTVPVQARRLLKRCLEKDPQKRLRHIGDVMSLLDEPPSGPLAPLWRLPPHMPRRRPREAGAHKFPQFLPDGRRFLYLRAGSPAQTGVYVGDIDRAPTEQSGERILAVNRQAYFAASPGGGPGHLVFLRGTTLMAQPFDPDRIELSSDAVPIAEGVDSFPAQFYGLFSVSNNGTLVYREGVGDAMALTWFDQNGKPAGVLGEPGDYANPAVSPDQSRVAVARGPVGARDIWIVDIVRGSSSRFTFDPANDDNPVWSPDSTQLVFSSNRSGQPRMFIKPADGSGEERQVIDQPGTPTSWSGDGRFLLFTSSTPQTAADVWALPDPRQTGANAKPFIVVGTSFAESNGQFSPDGRWVAYGSNESSTLDVFVRAFSPEGTTGSAGAKWLVSRPGLNAALRWHPGGKRLFYGSGTTYDLMAVDIDTSKGFQAGTPQPVFRAPPPFLSVNWDFGPGAQRFIFVTTPDGGKPTPFTVVLNWAATLRN